MAGTLKNMTELRAKYASLQERKDELERQATEAANALWKFMDDHAYRQAVKPYEICGDDDGQGRKHLECQLPKGHREIGYRNHLECKPDGSVWGAWS